ncbi:unnamed protein product, partial [marine sediment metagenome]
EMPYQMHYTILQGVQAVNSEFNHLGALNNLTF